MSLALIVGLCSMLLAELAGAAESAEQDWRTYRSEKFGFEIAYPAGMEFRAYFDGVSASLKDAKTGGTLVELTCMRETYPESHDETDEAEPETATVETAPLVTEEGRKGPTYFTDISPSWKKRILSADPVGVDPRMGPTREQIDPAILRKILGTVKTFPIQQPSGICIEELQHRGLTIGTPPR